MYCFRFVTLLSVLYMVCTVSAQGQPQNRASVQNISILVALRDPSICIAEERLRLSVLILNESDHPATLDVGRLSSTVSFSALIDTTQMKFRTESHGSNSDPIGSGPRSSQTVLPSKAFLRREIEIPLRDSFFARAGFYSIFIATSLPALTGEQSSPVYASNTEIFELKACSP